MKSFIFKRIYVAKSNILVFCLSFMLQKVTKA